jgi:hypothetical protein
MMHAALEINIPRYATAIVTTNEIVDLMSSAHALELAGHWVGYSLRGGGPRSGPN